MEVIPAIDIKGGKCVRLYQGDYKQETVFSDSPVSIASRWESMGASRLHVVDLDGAKNGTSTNIELVEDIASSVSARVQLGGGIRTLESAKKAISLGVSRIVIGTAAVESQSLVSEVCRELGTEAVMISVDARDGYVAVEGWTRSSRIHASELIKRIEAIGVERFVYTDIIRDGTLTEPNYHTIADLADQTNMHILVAGGITSIDHLEKVSQLGVEAAIIGKAAYTGDINLREAIATVTSSNNKST